jgi:hypothetical protein
MKPQSTPIPKTQTTLEELLTFDNIKSMVESRGYKFFDTADRRLNLNIVGVRRDNTGTNTFDDYLLVLYREEELSVVSQYDITTDPGQYWLENPANPKGTAVLKPGQYRSTWELGKHQGKYEALVQRKPVKVYRDNNKDEVIDYDSMTTMIDEGYFGINIHRSNPYDQSYVVNKWSAGCQVFKKVEDYNSFIKVCKESAQIYGNSFTYTLITEKDLRKHLDK